MKKAYQEEYDRKLKTAEEAAQLVKSGDHVYIGTCTSIAYALARALGDRMDELSDVTSCVAMINKPLEIMSGKDPSFRVCSYFLGSVERKVQAMGLLDYTSVHLSQVDQWMYHVARPNVAFLEVSLPDENGYMSLGSSGVCVGKYAIDCADTIVLQVNRHAPYVTGEDALIHVSQADMVVEADEEIFAIEDMPPSPEMETISRFLIDEIHDGDCIQLGIGGLAGAVGYGLKDKNDLNCHTELITDSIMWLMKHGNITNKNKGFLPGKTGASFSLGSRELYEFLDHNKDVSFMPMPVSNDIRNIAANDNMVSINTALSIDLMGQVVADNIEGRQYSGVGGQIDFVRGAQMSRGGRSYIAVTSTFNNSKTGRGSRIVPYFKPGTAITTPRSEVQYIVTEYGCINLKQLSMKDRVMAMISLAHPDYRGELTEEARKMKLL